MRPNFDRYPPEDFQRPDPRLARTDLAVDFMNAAMPHFKLMHEMTTDHVHEEIQLLANDFSTMFFETIAEVPAWRDYYLDHDQAQQLIKHGLNPHLSRVFDGHRYLWVIMPNA